MAPSVSWKYAASRIIETVPFRWSAHAQIVTCMRRASVQVCKPMQFITRGGLRTHRRLRSVIISMCAFVVVSACRCCCPCCRRSSTTEIENLSRGRLSSRIGIYLCCVSTQEATRGSDNGSNISCTGQNRLPRNIATIATWFVMDRVRTAYHCVFITLMQSQLCKCIVSTVKHYTLAIRGYTAVGRNLGFVRPCSFSG
jgi:hypothetical protein